MDTYDALPGKRLDGRYYVVRKLATGGFGQTYIAEDLRRPGNPQCVVKLLKPASSDLEFLGNARRLFITEAETLERLGNHEQIPRLLAYFEESADFYLVQEYIDGFLLTEELKVGERWPLVKTIELIQEVLKILRFIHSHNVIHRDIKPDNLIRRRSDGQLVLVDFGTVKQIRTRVAVAGQATATISVGTPGYMPTEQSHGKPRPSSDIYALGIIAIQAITGLHPTQLQEDADSGELIWQPWAACDEELIRIVTKMVRYHFRDRYQSASEALQAVSQYVASHPELTRELGPDPALSSPVLDANPDSKSLGHRPVAASEPKPTIVAHRTPPIAPAPVAPNPITPKVTVAAISEPLSAKSDPAVNSQRQPAITEVILDKGEQADAKPALDKTNEEKKAALSPYTYIDESVQRENAAEIATDYVQQEDVQQKTIQQRDVQQQDVQQQEKISGITAASSQAQLIAPEGALSISALQATSKATSLDLEEVPISSPLSKEAANESLARCDKRSDAESAQPLATPIPLPSSSLFSRRWAGQFSFGRPWLRVAAVGVVALAGVTSAGWLWQKRQDWLQAEKTLAQVEAFQGQKAYADCVNAAKSIPENYPQLYASAQNLMGDCLLAQAEIFAGEQRFKDAIASVENILPSMGAYSTAQENVPAWAQSIFETATNNYKAGQFEAAKAIIQAIPTTVDIHQTAQASLVKWETEWQENTEVLAAAQASLKEKSWKKAIEQTKKVTLLGEPVAESHPYWKRDVKSIVDKAQKEITAAQKAEQQRIAASQAAAPAPSQPAPAANYSAPVYSAPAPSYSAPAYSPPPYSAPAPTYSPPAPTYSAPPPSSGGGGGWGVEQR